jgi:molybdopterin synthase catalytic subunit
MALLHDRSLLMTVKVRLFAGLRGLVGDRDIELTLPAGATVATLREQIGREYPVLEPFLGTLACAVAEEVQPPEHPLADGDLVDIIPPIAGG